MIKVYPFISVLRPWQWIKNLLVFAPLFFAGHIFNTYQFTQAALLFGVFSLAAGIVYIINDISDTELDRLHPKKKSRPIASGALTQGHAVVWLCVLMLVMIVCTSLYIPQVAPIITIYMVLNILYSRVLKHIPIIDIVTVSVCYVLRVVAGGIGTNTYISSWIILCTLFVALFVIIGKRRSELLHEHKRKVLTYYNEKTLDFLLIISIALTLVAYGIYSVLGNESPYAVYSNIPIIIGVFRYIYIATNAQSVEFPEKILFKDVWIGISFVVWLVYMFIIFYIL